MQGQQIGIAGEDRVSLAVQSGFEKLVVFGITALADLVHHLASAASPPTLAQNARMGHPAVWFK
jgi:hypothetical protein